ncbi:ribonuclease activity regulator RraA [Nocardioides sp. LMS-CY]|uniref:RraA family protein n=1 Tax=Nocardioides sp. (strain LMS-CY) TaxID=2840457 RepID=UPI001C000DB9|nr:ribonuclease activity regulator RraA [Nocardioides sp. LMS-CY]QWF20603.1 ribonuclease activity regulator RraA [Nocardioides sp. LMS-CY]
MSPAEEAALEQLRQVGTANVANALYTRGFRNVVLHGVVPLGTDQEQLVGPAYTLRFIPAREDLDSLDEYAEDSNLHRRAIEEAPPGSVLVIDAFGSTRASSMGDMMATRLRQRGVVGVVTDGGYRDATGIAATGLPCYQTGGAPPATPIALHPIALDEPVGCAGVAVYPGDIVVGDRDGVVVVPRHLVVEVAQAAYDAHQYEQFAELQIGAGRPIFGLFPATPESRTEYDAWVAAGRPHPEESA